MKPSVTITLTRYAEPDALVRRSLAHALGQTGVDGEVLFVEQKSGSTIEPADFPDANLGLRIVRTEPGGLSRARNTALEEARFPKILFLDADALAETDFALRLAEVLSMEKVAIAGARIVPEWTGKAPSLARARAVYDQFSLLDLGEETRPYHRVVGAGFGVDMGKLPDGFRFDEKLGRRDGRLFGGEESDFCRRVSELGFETSYVGAAVVRHVIEPERMKLGWITKRLVYAGHGRAKLGGSPAPGGKASWADWLLAPFYLPPYALGWLWGKLGR